MKLFCRIFGHNCLPPKKPGLTLVVCERCGKNISYDVITAGKTTIYIPKGAIDIDKFKEAWSKL